MNNEKQELRSEIVQFVKDLHPVNGFLGMVTMEGLVRAILDNKLSVLPSAHEHESIRSFSNILCDAHIIADTIRTKYSNELIDEYISNRKS